MTNLYKYPEFSRDETRVRDQVMKMSHRYAHVKQTTTAGTDGDVQFQLTVPDEMPFGKDGIAKLQ